jgi:hypothetical protein
MATAVVATIILTLLVPNQVRIAHIPRFWPILELLLLGVLIVGDPGRIDQRSKNLHRISMALVGLLVTGAMVQTLALTTELIDGGAAATSGARTLLEAGAAVWVVNNIAYALLYWPIRTSRFRSTWSPASPRRAGIRSFPTTSIWGSPTPSRSARRMSCH